MLGGFAAALLSDAAAAALAANALDAPMILADRTLVRLERLDIVADPATGEPGEATRRRLQRLLAGEQQRGCVVAAQVLGRIDPAELDGGDPLEAHRRARARAERVAAALSAAGIEPGRILAGWDSSRPGDPGRMTIWLLTDWSEPGCGLLPGDDGPRIAPAPSPAGLGLPAALAPLGLPASAAEGGAPRVTPAPSAADAIVAAQSPAAAAVPTEAPRLALLSPSPGVGAAGGQVSASSRDEPALAATRRSPTTPTPGDAVRPASAEARPIAARPGSEPERASSAAPAEPTPAASRPDALGTLAARFGRIGQLFEREAASRPATSASPAPHPSADPPTAPAAPRTTRAAAREITAPSGSATRSTATPAPVGGSAILAAASAEAQFAATSPMDAAQPFATVAATKAPPPVAAPTAPPPVATAVAPPAPPLVVTAVAPPEPEGRLRETARASEPTIAAMAGAVPDAPAALPAPAAGQAHEELAFRFPAKSSILDTAQKRQLEALVRQLPNDRPVSLQLTVAVGSGDVVGADEATARRYNRWLAQRRAARVERWLRHYAGDREVVLQTNLQEDDPSRTARLTLFGGR